MQSLPIASFIIVLIIWFGSKNVASYISFIVVFPMIYNSVITGVGNVDSKILEMAQVFNVPWWSPLIQSIAACKAYCVKYNGRMTRRFCGGSFFA